MTRAAVLCAILLSVSTASADDAYYPPPPAPELDQAPVYGPSMVAPVQPQPVYVAPNLEDGPKSPSVAVLLSVVASAAPPMIVAAAYGDDESTHHDRDEVVFKVLLASTILGPSVGHVYAGKPMTVGLGVRVLGFGLGLAAFDQSDTDDAIGLLLLGSGLVVGGAIYDIATAGSSAREYNFEHAKRMMPTVAPVVGAGGQTSGMQVGLAGNF